MSNRHPSMPTLQVSATSSMKRFFPARSPRNRRGTLRDLYTFGLVSVFRRESVLRVWEPLREAPRPPQTDEPAN